MNWEFVTVSHRVVVAFGTVRRPCGPSENRPVAVRIRPCGRSNRLTRILPRS